MRVVELLAAIAALWAMPAQAANLSKFYLTGTITEQTSAGDPVPFGVGSTITLEAMADLSQAAIWGDTGYKMVGFYGNPTFKITIGGKQISSIDEILDGNPFYFDGTQFGGAVGVYIGAPAVFFKDGKIAGVFGYFAAPGDVPVLYSGSYGQGYKDFCHWPEPPICSSYSLVLSDEFRIDSNLLYFNRYYGPEFKGIWNFEQSIAPVPESSSWATLILGIGLAGATMRRRRAFAYARRTTRALVG